MNKPYVVLADLDANYLIPLEERLTEELYDRIELEVITDKQYFDSFFLVPRKIDTLIISSELFSESLLRHNVTDFFLLTEEPSDTQSTDHITRIFKYSSAKEILNQILSKNRDMLEMHLSRKETQVILVTSCVGGAGKTTLSLALCERLAKNHKRVLFISADPVQSFSYYLQNREPLPNSAARTLGGAGDELYRTVMPYLRNEGFSYLPPFGRSVSSNGLDENIYNRLIAAAKAAREYDCIVADAALGFDGNTAKMIQDADKVIVTVLQDAYSTYKTEYLVRNIDCRDSDKFLFVCNKFRRDADNEYMNSDMGRQFMLSEYVEEVPAHRIYSLDSFSELSGVKNLAYIFC